MNPLQRSPRRDLERIWTAALAAIDPRRLVAALPPSLVTPPGSGLVAVVGGGKAAAGMAAGVADLLGAGLVAPQRIRGVVSVPAGVWGTLTGGLGHGSSPGGSPAGTVSFPGEPHSRTRVPLRQEAPHPSPEGIEIRATRPAGVNQPTAAVVAATGEMLHLLATLGADDLAIAVITGGGSALLEQPAAGVELADVIAVTEALSRAGADIEALNTVRRAVSRVKAGGLARACRAGRMVALVLSDVIGDPLDFIASGPCMPTAADPAAARAVLDRFAIAPAIAPRLAAYLAHASRPTKVELPGPEWTTSDGCHVRHMIVGHNATAVAAARAAAGDLGYRIVSPVETAEPDGAAESVGVRIARLGSELARQVAHDGHPRAWIEGGEATVTVPTAHGHGGRNQQTVLAALVAASAAPWPRGLALASIGTDGEDGPTDAAGAMADADVWALAATDPAATRGALERCDAHPLLDRIGGLVRTGPTGTNVADLRIVLACP